uniref:Selenoprotein P N-terminal domain-containing protein n=1 Tax=Esox lucius TaxID=8010 RepID=A0A3P8ZCY3_ESOLU
MVVNHQGEKAQRLHKLLKQKLSEKITLYKQEPEQVDVWQSLAGQKDDFLIYDRCGRLTYHISLPYSIMSIPYVENAIKETYCARICGNCKHEVGTHSNSVEPTHDGHQHHRHHHHHHHDDKHGDHGDREVGRGHGAEQQRHHKHVGEGHRHVQDQLHVSQDHVGQTAVQLGQETNEGQVMQRP